MTDIIIIAGIAVVIVLLILVIIISRSSGRNTADSVQNNIRMMSDIMSESQRQSTENQRIGADNQDKRLAELSRQFNAMNIENEQKLDMIRTTMEKRLAALQEENGRQLDQMRNTVDEKLQKTLEERIGKSFSLVNERLQEVYEGLGEMTKLAKGVDDLSKVLSNVKTRGIVGEIQLGAILEQILSPEQYEENVNTKGTGSERVEFAVKMPGSDDGTVWLPIDSKFPGDTYSYLMDAYENGDKAAIDAAGRQLETVIRNCAKDIHNKYVAPPQTTDFAIMFLPFEGLYAEVVRRGLVEKLQADFKVNIAGPTTMAALLNSLQMGFRTLAIEKHSSQVWDILSAVKTEFSKFESVLLQTQQRINQANTELDKLVGTRTRSINRKLKDVSALGEKDSGTILGLDDAGDPAVMNRQAADADEE